MIFCCRYALVGCHYIASENFHKYLKVLLITFWRNQGIKFY